MSIAFRNPDYFGKVVGLSGRYDLTRRVGAFPDLFDGYYDEDIYFHTPSHFIPNLTDPCLLGKLRALDITLAVGEADLFCDSTRHLSGALWEKGVPNRLDVWSGKRIAPESGDRWCRSISDHPEVSASATIHQQDLSLEVIQDPVASSVPRCAYLTIVISGFPFSTT